MITDYCIGNFGKSIGKEKVNRTKSSLVKTKATVFQNIFFGILFDIVEYMKKKYFSKSILTFLLVYGCLTYAHLSYASGLGMKCSELFGARNFKFQDLRYTSRKHKTSKQPSVEVEQRIQDEAGRSLFIFKKIGEHWWSTYTPAPNNYQGDPRWFPILIGGKAAAYFGFKKIDDTRMTAPTADTLNHSIQNLNVVLSQKNQEPIEMRFHESGTEVEEGVDFLRSFATKTSLPVARDGHYAVHDISYHSLSILLPKEILDGVKKRSEIFLRLMEKVENDTKIDPIVKKILRKTIRDSIEQLVRNIDYGTGNIGFILAMEKANQHNQFKQPYQAYDLSETVIRHLVTNSQRLLEDFQENAMDVFASEIGHIYGNPEDVAEYIPLDVPREDRKVIVSNAETKLKLVTNSLIKSEQRSIKSARQEIKIETFVNFIRTRIRNIQEAAVW